MHTILCIYMYKSILYLCVITLSRLTAEQLLIILQIVSYLGALHLSVITGVFATNFCPSFQHLLSERLASLGIMGAPRVPPLNPSETIVLSEHYRL